MAVTTARYFYSTFAWGHSSLASTYVSASYRQLPYGFNRLFEASAPPPAVGLASAPPFITALAFSPRGAVAAGCADGRVWIGLGGEKPSGTGAIAKKRSRKWMGLSEEGFFIKVDEVMIAALYAIFSKWSRLNKH